MIRVDLGLHVLVCSHCEDPTEIPRRIRFDQHAVLELKQAVERDHRDCRAGHGDAAKARRNRRFRLDMQREQDEAAGIRRPMRRRCNGKPQ